MEREKYGAPSRDQPRSIPSPHYTTSGQPECFPGDRPAMLCRADWCDRDDVGVIVDHMLSQLPLDSSGLHSLSGSRRYVDLDPGLGWFHCQWDTLLHA